MNSAVLITTAGAATAGTGVVVGVVAPTDWSGIAQAITALGVLVVSAGTVITSLIQVKQKKDSDEIKTEIKETKAAVNGATEKLLAARVDAATSAGALEEQVAAAARKGIADEATLKEKERAAGAVGVSDAVPVEVTNSPDEAVPVSAKRTKTKRKV